jgi:hypothetical protein
MHKNIAIREEAMGLAAGPRLTCQSSPGLVEGTHYRLLSILAHCESDCGLRNVVKAVRCAFASIESAYPFSPLIDNRN